MGKTYLTEKELEQFPTISELANKIGDSNINKWGLCQNESGDIALGEDSDSWQLVIPLSDIHEEAHAAFGENYSPSNMRVVYSVELYPDLNIVSFELVDVFEYEKFKEEIIKYPPIILETVVKLPN